MQSHLYEILPVEFRIPNDPLELVRVWRGDKIGRAATGMTCRLGDPNTAQKIVLQAAEAGVEAMNELIDRHTDADPNSPLLSVTNAVARAQGYTTRPDETIYELRLPAARLIRDAHNIGSPRKGNETELFVVGRIEPDDVIAVKTNNTDWQASELRMVDDRGVNYLIKPLWHPTYRHDPNRTPNPEGQWDRSRHWAAQAQTAELVLS